MAAIGLPCAFSRRSSFSSRAPLWRRAASSTASRSDAPKDMAEAAAQGAQPRALAERSADDAGAAAAPDRRRRARGARARGDRRLLLRPRRCGDRRRRAALDRAAHAPARASARDVGDVDLRFSGPAAQDPRGAAIFKRVRDGWPLRRGQPFRQADWDAAKRRAAARDVLLALRRRAHRRRAKRGSTARRMARVADGGAGERPALPLRRDAHQRHASATPDELVQNLSPIQPGDDLRPRQAGDRLPAAPAGERLLRERAGRDRSQRGSPDAAPLRVAVIEALQAPRRGRRQLHHRCRLPRRVQLHQPGAVRFGVALPQHAAAGRHDQEPRVQLRFAAAAGRLWNSVPAAAVPRDRHPERAHARGGGRHLAQLGRGNPAERGGRSPRTARRRA